MQRRSYKKILFSVEMKSDKVYMNILMAANEIYFKKTYKYDRSRKRG